MIYNAYYFPRIKMDTKTPKERLLINLRKGNAEKVAAIIKQFPGIKIKIFHVGQSVRRSVRLYCLITKLF